MGLTPITVTFGAGAAAVVVGANTWVSPGISEDNFCTPRPLVAEVPPELDELGAAIPDRGVGLDEDNGVGLDTAPINERDVVGVVVVVDVLCEATVFDAVGVWDVESLLTVGVVVFSTGAIGTLRAVEAVEDVVAPSNWADPIGDDFLISLCGLRIRDDSLVVEGVLAVPLSESWALS